MSKKLKIILSVVVILILAIILISRSNDQIKIGVVSPLTGGAAYWGESSLVGIELAKKDLQSEGINIEVVPEDGQLDPNVALSAAQKLVNVDGVDVIYSEFNPASIAVSSFLKDKDVFHLYDSAAASPLDEGPYNFKTYLDYRDSCGDVSQYIKDNDSVARVGVLKMNLEHGNLCVEGIKEVFGEENVFVEEYNPGVTDFRTSILKINSQGVGAIFHASFQPETLASLKQLDELGINKLFIGLSETITPDVVGEYDRLIQNDVFFGLPEVRKDLRDLIVEMNNGEPVADYNAAALAYIHISQLGRALDECGDNNECVSDYLSNTEPVESIGFEGFENRIAVFKNQIVRFVGGEFVDIQF